MTKEERKLLAEKHFNYMERDYVKPMTIYSRKCSVIYDNKIYYDNDIIVSDCTTEQAILKFHNVVDPILCVLNFASFTRPGGGFIKGSIAQEEALCHSSNLYNVLLAFKDEYDKNYNKSSFKTGLYENWAIYSPQIYFEGSNGISKLANVITCPAPNYSVYKEKYTDDVLYKKTLKSRIKYVLDIARDQNQKILILGAFGCGVFGNDPTLVANYFKELLKEYKFEKVIFAIPNDRNGNYKAFKNVFNNDQKVLLET